MTNITINYRTITLTSKYNHVYIKDYSCIWQAARGSMLQIYNQMLMRSEVNVYFLLINISIQFIVDPTYIY